MEPSFERGFDGFGAPEAAWPEEAAMPAEENAFSPSLDPLFLPQGSGAEEGLDPLAERFLEISSIREARLSADSEKLSQDLTEVSTRLQDEKEREVRLLKEAAERVHSGMAQELIREKEDKARRLTELGQEIGKLASENKRFLAINIVLGQEARQAKERLDAVLKSLVQERDKAAALSHDLARKLSDLQKRMEIVERQSQAQIASLETVQEKLRTELVLKEDVLAQARETTSAVTRRAEEAERGLRNWEDVWARQEEVVAEKIAPAVRAELESSAKEEIEKIRAVFQKEFDDRLARAREESRLDREASLAGLQQKLLEEKEAALERLQKELLEGKHRDIQEAVSRAREEAVRAAAQEHESRRTHLQAEDEERLARQGEDHARILKQTIEEARLQKEVALAVQKAELIEAKEREIAEAVRRARAETEAAVLESGSVRLVQAQKGWEEAKEKEIAWLKEQFIHEKGREVEASRKERGDEEMQLQEEHMRRLEAAREEWQRGKDSEITELKLRFALDRDKELSVLRAARESELSAMRKESQSEKDRRESELSAMRKEVQADKDRLENELRRNIRRELELEFTQGMEKMGQDWAKLRARFDEELSKVREELKRREQEWKDRQADWEREAIRAREDARAQILRLEKEGVALAHEKGHLAEERARLESELHLARETSEAAQKRLSEEKEVLERQSREEKQSHDSKFADLKKELEAKLKTLEAQLREERRKTAELEARNQELGRSFWDRMKGGRKG